MINNNIEILAPVGGKEQLISAINAATDAVYIGVKDFSARHSAKNFTNEEIPDVIKLCHKNGVKLYATINTLLTDREIGKALDIARAFYENNADALILADEGLAYLVNKYLPHIKMHASTQMASFNYEDVKRLKELGFSRIILPRELSLEDVKNIVNKIKKNNLTDKFGNLIEIEVFCHGALCMSVSGRCYLSAIIGQRSGNRGRCAQPCRLPFYLNDKNNKENTNYALSLKDLFAGDYAQKLIDIGVTSLKIEGRMKSPEYVYEVIKAYKNLNNISTKETKLQNLFSRNGFTNGFLENKIGSSMFGIRTNDNKKSTFDSNKIIDYKITLNNKKPIVSNEIEKTEKIALFDFNKSLETLNKYPTFIFSFMDFEQIGDNDNNFEVYLDFTNAVKNFERLKEKNITGIVLPKIVREINIDDFTKKLTDFYNIGITKVFGCDIGTLIIAKKIGFKINADFAINVFNSYSLKQLEKYDFERIILSAELSFPQIRDLNKQCKCGIIGYGKLNLMTFRNCIIKNNTNCIKMNGFKDFTDRRSEVFNVFCSYDCSNSLYNGKPIYIADLDYNNLGLDFIRLDFTTESKNEVNSIIKKYKTRKKADFDFTRGLYNRGVL
ncbi:MAG: U32 family peptidase [Clostridia bacterium]